MAATTTMHFGPEWMRAKPPSCAPRTAQPAPPSPPLPPSSYSALVTPLPHEPGRRDDSRPFRYTKDDLLRIYKEGGGRGGLNLEVERWEGIVRDVAGEPAALREMSDTEKKLFAGPLNSELRRRQSTDLISSLSSSDRQRLAHPNSTPNNTARYAPFSARRRDSIDQPPLTLPRKLSLSNTQGTTLASPRDALPSPRSRIGPFSSGFDGVLNNGDSWSRRRLSVGASGTSGNAIPRAEGKEEDPRHSEIREEEESAGRHSLNVHDTDSAAVTDISSSSSPDGPSSDVQASSLDFDSLGQKMKDLSLGAQNQSHPQGPSSMNLAPFGPPPSLTDPSSVEWSYLDPQGQVQGPFRADLMQKWFDEGYFTPDLLMKRTHIDTDWIAVGMLESRAAGGRIFLPQISNGPPGLAIRTESPKSYSPIQEQNVFNGYQPGPAQALRTTLDSSLNGTSPIESPSPSLGGGRFGNDSPDPSLFGCGRPGNGVFSGDASFAGRSFASRATIQDSVSDTRTFNSNILGRAPTIDTRYSGDGDSSPWSAGPGQGFNDSEHHSYSNGLNGSGPHMMGNPLPVHHGQGINQEHYGDATYSGMGSLSNHYDSPIVRQPSDVSGITFSNNVVNSLGSQFGVATQFSQASSVPYTTPQHRQSVPPFGDLLPQTTDGLNVAQTPTSAVQPNDTSPWTTRSRAFESPAVPSPIVPPAQPQASEWIPPQSVDPSPWLMASLPVVDDVWREMPGPNSLTFSNLGQHNRLQQQEEEVDDVIVSPVESVVAPPPDSQPTTESEHAISGSGDIIRSQSVLPEVISDPTPDTQGSTAPKARRKSTTRTSAPKIAPPPTPAVVKDLPIIPALPIGQPKPVWAVEDESKKQKGVGTTISLREIQEAEVRKVEARKAAEKERERATHANSTGGSSVVEESQPFTSSWGLSSSQAGVRSQIPSKETSTVNTTPTTSAAPVWTNTVPQPTAKKTMKEIQEEEERRKKSAVKDSMASAAARRAYAETTLKVVPSTQATSGSWTTVGPNGKPTLPATSIPRPSANPPTNNATPTTTPRSNGSTATRQASATAVKATTPRVEDFPVTPSHDFLKWLGESLKGLNSSVNLEEITSMLLSFPLDPDSSTLEIISDLIYANSTTLDGRRFASEYVNKRKVDVAARRATAGASGPGNKPVSIADVVKTQPKPVQQEWGFKVVNKKKKGGRS